MREALVSLVTALADDELIIGHRHSEWTGFAPHIEEDVAFSSIAQDEIGHAAAYYSLIAEATGASPDRMALGRQPDDYRHAVLCERPNGDWSYSLVRHWLYDTADDVRLEALQESADAGLAALAVKMRREERYHLLHANAWIKRVAEGPIEGRTRLIDALGKCYPEALALFDSLELEDSIVDNDLLPCSSSELRARFAQRATSELDDFGLPADIHRDLDNSAEFLASSSGDLIASEQEALTTSSRSGIGGRAGKHSDDFKPLWDEMTSTHRLHPDAHW
ncbi:MAG TPA: 1,2-phenylacetyl-CoA epoxidase subunit PaaC [Actinomycetota bacterium]|nr:1,2-phenylacetyl-CoA epoxidase subunit PaaC [Actinomycetota bacterium]